jgi:hypothetical protein
MEESGYFESLIGKHICLERRSETRRFFYNGTIKKVDNNSIYFYDDKCKEILKFHIEGLYVLDAEV